MTAITPTPRNLLVALSLDSYLDVDWADQSANIEIREQTRPDLLVRIHITTSRNTLLPTDTSLRVDVFNITQDDEDPIITDRWVDANVDAVRRFIDTLPAGATDPAFDPPAPATAERIVTVAGIFFEDPDEPMADAFSTYEQAIDYIASVENLDRDEEPPMSAASLAIEQVPTMDGMPKIWQIRADQTYSGRYYRIYENYLNPVL